MAAAVDARIKGGYAMSSVPFEAMMAIRFGFSSLMFFLLEFYFLAGFLLSVFKKIAP
jgi:hypothetical protein